MIVLFNWLFRRKKNIPPPPDFTFTYTRMNNRCRYCEVADKQVVFDPQLKMFYHPWCGAQVIQEAMKELCERQKQ